MKWSVFGEPREYPTTVTFFMPRYPMRYLISEVAVDMDDSPSGGGDVLPIPGRSGTMILTPRCTQISRMLSTVRMRLPGMPWKNNMTLSPTPYSAQEMTRFPSAERICRSDVVKFGYAGAERFDLGGCWRFRAYVVYASTVRAVAAVKHAPTTTGRLSPMISNKVLCMR